MFSTIGTALIILALIFGGGGVTLVAAQDSQPDQALYGVKTWSEDVRADLANDEQARIQLELEFATRRANEMRVMLEAGEIPPQSVQTRLMTQIDNAIKLAAGQPDDAMLPALEQIQERLRATEQMFHQFQESQLGELNQVRNMLQERIQLCEDGLQDPERLRERLQEREQLRDGTQADPSRTPARNGNQWVTGTPAPGAGYGPGEKNGNDQPQRTGTPTAQNRFGPDPKDQGQFGLTKTTTPGGGNDGNPTPNQDGNGNNNPDPDPGGNGNPPPNGDGNGDDNGGGNGDGGNDGGGGTGGNGGK